MLKTADENPEIICKNSTEFKTIITDVYCRKSGVSKQKPRNMHRLYNK